MKLVPFFASLLLIVSCSAAPAETEGKGTENIVITKKIFLNDFVLYTGKHDIVKIFAPLNQFDFGEKEITGADDSDEDVEHPYTIFFVEADIEDGKKTDQGLYVYKKNQATKLLDNGRDAVTTHENVTYFAAKDGIYKYDEAENKAVKYGAVTDNIVQLAFNNKTNHIYYLTEGSEVFKLNSDASASVKIEKVKNAKTIVFGFEGNLYYLDSDNNVYVLNVEDESSVPKKVEGLPEGYKSLVLISPIYGIQSGAVLSVDGSLYFIEASGSVYKSKVTFEVKPTAFAPQPTLIQYYAQDKKIYEFNALYVMIHTEFQEIKSFFDNNKSSALFKQNKK